MSCALTPISCIADLGRLKSLLEDAARDDQNIVDKGFGDDVSFGGNEDSWQEDWDSSDEWTSARKVVPVETGKKAWLQKCIISLSPLEELLVVAAESKAVFLTQKWSTSESADGTPTYEVGWSGALSAQVEDPVSCLVCVPLASQQRSSEGNPDLTCVIAGFKSGYIRIFMPNGMTLLSQIFHEASVLHVKVKTRDAARWYHAADQVDELVILYPEAIVTIDGFSLYQSLRACRNQLAKVQASSAADVVKPPPLAYRKWKIKSHDQMNDVISCGLFTPCLFDRLQTASLTGGFRATVKGSSPAFNHFLTCGKKPFLSVYQGLEGSSPPLVSEVALAVASKLTSAVMSRLTAASGWFTGSGKSQSSPVPAKTVVENGTKLDYRFCLQDRHRQAKRITVSPLSHLAAVTDEFNRVLLVDTQKGVVIRMWKGYRDAECGWVVVDEEKEESDKVEFTENILHKRQALFLVIYAPKRGILEIWLTEHGPRVGAFNVGKDCRLLYQSHGFLGQGVHDVRTLPRNACFLLMSDGALKSVHVPFHCSLSATHSVRVKDLHLLKKLSVVIDKISEKDSCEAVCKSLTSILLEIQVPSSQLKGIQSILSASSLSAEVLRNLVQKIIANLSRLDPQCSNEDIEYEAECHDVVSYCDSQMRLIDMYLAVFTLCKEEDGPDSLFDTSHGEQVALSDLLQLTASESEELAGMLRCYAESCLKTDFDRTVVVPSVPEMTVALFLSCFEVSDFESSEQCTSTRARKKIDIRNSLSQDVKISLGMFLYKSAINGLCSISKLTLILEASTLSPRQMMMVLAAFTQSAHCQLVENLRSVYYLRSLVSSLCSIKGGPESESMHQAVGEISSWWQAVRDVLDDSVLLGQALVMAVVCRSVAIQLTVAAQKVKQLDESDITEGGWVSVTVDMEQWNLLVSRLEDVLLLDCFVHRNHERAVLEGLESPSFRQHLHSPKASREEGGSKSDRTPLAPVSKTQDRVPVMSVAGISQGGHGAVAQIVADCLVRQGVPGPCLGKPKSKSRRSSHPLKAGITRDEEEDIPDDMDHEPNAMDTLTGLSEIRQRFPYSLEQDVLWVHCAWESIMVWNEDCENVSMLSCALVHLTCVHNPVLQHGLCVMMWKAVFKESVKQVLSLIEKIGKAPKDRLCKKTVGLSYKALEDFFGNAKQLIEILLQIDVDDEDEPKFRSEEHWQRVACVRRSIAEQAADEPVSDPLLLEHLWNLVTMLYLIMLGGMKGVKPLSLFDTKGKHAFGLPLHSSPLLSTELDDKIHEARSQFCLNAVTSLVKDHVALTFDDEQARRNTSLLLSHADVVFVFARKTGANEDMVRRHFACELYASGLDIAGHEVFLLIENKDDFASRLLDIVGCRIATHVLDGDTALVSEAMSKLPTNITSWLRSLEPARLRVQSFSFVDTVNLAQFVHANLPAASKESRFVGELCEYVKLFL